MASAWLIITNDNVIIPYPLNKNNTPPISIGTASQGSIKVDIYLSVSLILKDFTTEAPIIPEPEPDYTPVFLSKNGDPKPDTYELNWYTYEEEPSTSDTYELNWYTYGEDPKPDTYKLN